MPGCASDECALMLVQVKTRADGIKPESGSNRGRARGGESLHARQRQPTITV
jgi:hypothetical protein